jgi:hypothetical protein
MVYQFCIARLGLATVYVLDQIAHETQDQTKVLKSSTSRVSIVSQERCLTTALASGWFASDSIAYKMFLMFFSSP